MEFHTFVYFSLKNGQEIPLFKIRAYAVFEYSLLNIFSAFARSLPFCHINHIPTAAAATSAMTPPIFPKAFKPKATKIKASSNAFITAIK